MINYQKFSKLKKVIASKLKDGCDSGAVVLRDNTPIDTKRLWQTTRAEEPEINGNYITCRIIAGGLSIYGITRETDRKRDVDYAVFVNHRANYARESLVEIVKTIKSKLTK